MIDVYWAALAVHLLVTLYLIWRVDSLHKFLMMQIGLNQSLTDFATATVEEVEGLQDDVIDLQDQIDEITKTPATS
jgi:hypothetical protein